MCDFLLPSTSISSFYNICGNFMKYLSLIFKCTYLVSRVVYIYTDKKVGDQSRYHKSCTLFSNFSEQYI